MKLYLPRVFLFAVLLLVSSFILHPSSFAQDPPLDAGVVVTVAPAATSSGLDWTQIVAAIGAVIIIARLIVKLTPTPADDTWLEKFIEGLKHIGLNIKTVALLLLLGVWCLGFGVLTTGCGTSHPTTINVGSTNGNVSGGVTTQITTNINAGVTGSYDPTNGSWTAGLVITFKEAPPAAVLQLAETAGAVQTPNTKAQTPTRFIITRPDATSAAQTNFIEAALRSGATIERVVLSVP